MRAPPLPRVLRAVAAILLAAVLARGYHWPVVVGVPFFEALVSLLVLSPVGLLAPVAFANLLPPPLQGLRGALLVGLALALGATLLALAGPARRGAALNPAWRAGGGRSPGGSP